MASGPRKRYRGLYLVFNLGLFAVLLPSIVVAKRDTDHDGITNSADRCADTPTNMSVNAKGCHFDKAGALFTVQFKAGSAWVSGEQTLAIRNAAKQLVVIINDFPGTRIAVRGFNGGAVDRSNAEDLSLLRAKAVMRQLKLSRVPAAAMTVEGLGRAVVADKVSQAQRVDVLILGWKPPQ